MRHRCAGRRIPLAGLCVAALLGCEPQKETSGKGQEGQTALPTLAGEAMGKGALGRAGVVATVGSLAIRAESLVAATRSQQITPDAALDSAVYDALMANAAWLARPRQSRLAAKRVLARAIVRSIWLKAKSDPITEAELAAITRERFARYDRPKGKRIVHTVVQVRPQASAEKRAAARELAEKITKAATAASELAKTTKPLVYKDDSAFSFNENNASKDPVVEKLKAVTKTFADSGGDLLCQPLPVLAPDGRFIDFNQAPGTGVVPEFAKALEGLEQRGDSVGPVETSFGYHVIILLDTTEPMTVPRAKRLSDLSGIIRRRRARQIQARLLKEGVDREGVQVARNTNALLDLLPRSDVDLATESPSK